MENMDIVKLNELRDKNFEIYKMAIDVIREESFRNLELEGEKYMEKLDIDELNELKNKNFDLYKIKIDLIRERLFTKLNKVGNGSNGNNVSNEFLTKLGIF